MWAKEAILDGYLVNQTFRGFSSCFLSNYTPTRIHTLELNQPTEPWAIMLFLLKSLKSWRGWPPHNNYLEHRYAQVHGLGKVAGNKKEGCRLLSSFFFILSTFRFPGCRLTSLCCQCQNRGWLLVSRDWARNRNWESQSRCRAQEWAQFQQNNENHNPSHGHTPVSRAS